MYGQEGTRLAVHMETSLVTRNDRIDSEIYGS